MIKTTKLPDLEKCVIAHKLISLSEAILSPIRCLAVLARTPPSEARDATWWWLCVSAVGATGEAIIKFRESDSLQGAVRTAMARREDLLQILETITLNPPGPAVRIAMHARSKYWAHADHGVSARFINSLSWTPADPPLVASTGERTVEDSASPWPRQAWFFDLDHISGVQTEAEVGPTNKAVIELAKQVALLTRDLVPELLQMAGATVVPDAWPPSSP